MTNELIFLLRKSIKHWWYTAILVEVVRAREPNTLLRSLRACPNYYYYYYYYYYYHYIFFRFSHLGLFAGFFFRSRHNCRSMIKLCLPQSICGDNTPLICCSLCYHSCQGLLMSLLFQVYQSLEPYAKHQGVAPWQRTMD